MRSVSLLHSPADLGHTPPDVVEYSTCWEIKCWGPLFLAWWTSEGRDYSITELKGKYAYYSKGPGELICREPGGHE